MNAYRQIMMLDISHVILSIVHAQKIIVLIVEFIFNIAHAVCMDCQDGRTNAIWQRKENERSHKVKERER